MKEGGICLKRRVFALIVCLCLAFSLALTASADNVASSIQIYASVNTDGDADVTMTVRLRLDTPVTSLYYPLPSDATDIQLNEKGVTTTRTTSATLVNISSEVSGATGDFVLTFQYRIPDVVRMINGKLTLDLPLISGFEYPVQNVSLTVMLPGDVQGTPVFKSTYHQDSVDSILKWSVTNNLISGLLTLPLKDQETLSMTMTVPTTMFGGVSTYVRVGNPEVVPMGVLTVLALIYWLIFLRGMPLLRVRKATPPEGITAGEISSRLVFSGADLTTMVFTWAQMGYLVIHLDDNGRVMLHKRMDMGNERSAFEVKTFQSLFHKRRVVDGTGFQYARLAMKVSGTNPGKKPLTHPKNGNVKIFRWLMCAVQAFCGICFAMNFTGMVALQVILGAALSLMGAGAAWFIQGGMYRLHLRNKLAMYLSLGISVLWFLLGLWAGQWAIGLCCVLGQLLCGLMAAYGGRRSDLGRQNACQILGFRSFLKTVTKEDLTRIQKNDPEFFYNMLPYAMALGVDKAFARRFGKQKLPQCPYFICGVHTRMNAEDWARFFHESAGILDERFRRMRWEKYAIIRFR